MVEKLQNKKILRKKMDWNISILAAVSFYSRAVIEKLKCDKLNKFRKVDEYIKSLIFFYK